jgi:hypothetical protein
MEPQSPQLLNPLPLPVEDEDEELDEWLIPIEVVVEVLPSGYVVVVVV